MRSSPRAAVALPWTLPPATATRLLGGLYARIAEGAPVSEAARRGPRGAPARRAQGVGARHVEVDDWLVPTGPRVVAAAALRSGERPAQEGPAASRKSPPDDSELPDPPAWGFVERPEVLFTLDRAFDVHGTVLLHAFAGAGKTSLAREFALWYRQSGGLRGRSEETEPGSPLVELREPARPPLTPSTLSSAPSRAG